jgi:hypothetical protein
MNRPIGAPKGSPKALSQGRLLFLANSTPARSRAVLLTGLVSTNVATLDLVVDLS